MVKKKRTKKQIARNILKVIFTAFVFITSFIGTFSLYNYVVVGMYEKTELIFSPGQAHATMVYFRNTLIPKEDLDILIKEGREIVKGCKTDECKVKRIYNNLKHYSYELGADMNPINILNEEEGDCDEVSNLAMVLLKQQGVKGYLQCSVDHCWNVFNVEKGKVVVDIVSQRVEKRWLKNS